ncbi:probable ADP-ribosylation factor GTPase-activating protein AGD8 [Phoenix dactylifera]|uniref:Probable ADP-ribosylation factor GTPase-activating protein AGD8 n=1 Tax=Phoenix dactylifera TaxID=42345 RepID=A0A8B8ZJD5_PHODC|nr:probable ADP-ribosylation factor GTPase-activating protein AGD8 [Phoenix dactylifera]
MNFDGSVPIGGDKVRVAFVIRDQDSRLIATERRRFFEVSALGADLRIAWEKLSYVRQVLEAGCIILAGDSAKLEDLVEVLGRYAFCYSKFCKELAKRFAENSSNLSSPVASQSSHAADGLPNLKPLHTMKDNLYEKQEIVETTRSPKAPIQSPVINPVKRSIGGKKIGSKSGGLHSRKLATKPIESLYNQKPVEPASAVTSMANSMTAFGSSFPSRLEYVESIPSAENILRDAQVIGNVAPPKSTNLLAESGMDNGSSKKSASTTKIKVEESNEARQKFSNAKSISSAKFFGDRNKASDLQRFTASQDISALKDIAGETGKKLTPGASRNAYMMNNALFDGKDCGLCSAQRDIS